MGESAEDNELGMESRISNTPTKPLDLAKLDWSPNPPDKLTPKQRTFLKGLAHHLKPVVRIGQEGVTESIIGEIRQQLLSHELIKVKWSGLSKQEGNKKQQAEKFAEKAGAHFVHLIGQTVLLYREPELHDLAFHETKRIQLPD